MAEYLRSQIAKIAGVNIETLRYYENKGLIQPERTANRYRVYPEQVLNRLNFIKRAKEAGFSLEEIRQTLQLFDIQLNFEELSNIMTEGIAAKIKEIDERIIRLTQIRELLLEIHQGLQQKHKCPTLEPLLKKFD